MIEHILNISDDDKKKKNGNIKYILYLHPGGTLSLNWLFGSHMDERLNQ